MTTPTNHRITPSLALYTATVLTTMVGAAAGSGSGTSGLTTPVETKVIAPMESGDFVAAQAGWRLVDLDLHATSPRTWAGVAVEATGEYAGPSEFYGAISPSDLVAKCDADSLMVVDIDFHYFEGEWVFSVILEPDNGDEDTGFGSSHEAATIQNYFNNTDRYVIDVQPYNEAGTTQYSICWRSATPEDTAKQQRFYPALTRAQILDKIVNEGLRLVDLDTRPHDNYFAATMELDDDVTDWWVHDATKAELDEFVAQYGARVVDLEVYGDPNTPTYDALLRPNTDEVVHESNMLMRNLTDGQSGLKYSGWDTDGAIRDEAWFDPAQAFSFYYLFAAFDQLKFAPEDLDSLIPVRGGDGTDCPSDSGSLFFQPYRTVLSNMMYADNVQAAHAVYQQTGYNAIMDTLDTRGADDTYLLHEIGCFDQPVWNPTTLDDASQMMRHFMLTGNGNDLARTMRNLLDTDLSTPVAGTLSFQSILDLALNSSTMTSWDKQKFAKFITLISVDGTYTGYSDPTRGTNTTRWSYFFLPHQFEQPFFNGDHTGLVTYNASAFVNEGSDLWNSQTAVGLAIANMYKEAIHEAIDTWEQFPSPCPADQNGDGFTDNGDIGTFVERFLLGDMNADINFDGILDMGDVQRFIELFLGGCDS